jgi:hypothetical protein
VSAVVYLTAPRRGSDGTAPHPSAETMAPPSVPLKRSSGSFSDPDSHPTTDHRRAGPAQTPTLPPSSKTKRPTPFTSVLQALNSGSIPSPFQSPAHTPPSRSSKTPVPHPDASRPVPADTFYNTQHPAPRTDPQTNRAVTPTGTFSKRSPPTTALSTCRQILQNRSIRLK